MVPATTYAFIQQTVDAFVRHHGYCTPIPPELCAAAPAAPYEVWASLLSASMTAATKRHHGALRAHQAQRVQRFAAGAPLLLLASELHLPPTKVARDVLEGALKVRRSDVRELLRAPRGILRCALSEELAAGRGAAAQRALLRRLAADVRRATAADLKESPALDCAREWSGEEHEWRLLAGLAAAGVPPRAMLAEDEIRALGGARRSTPDVLLRWPIVVPCARGSGAAHAVRWLDSKASFADPLALDDSSMGAGRQVAKYLADFGPGMVVFWGGCVDALAAAAPAGVLLHHRPPARWRWATAEECDAMEAFREAQQEAAGEAGEAGGGGGGEGGGADPAALAIELLGEPPAGGGGGAAAARRQRHSPAEAAAARERLLRAEFAAGY
jgi:hypothetical protein